MGTACYLRVARHNQCSVWALRPDLSNHLRHELTASFVTTNKEAWNICWVLDALYGDVGSTSHHGAEGRDKWRARNAAHVAKFGCATGEKDGHWFATAAILHVVLSDRSKGGECGGWEEEDEGLHGCRGCGLIPSRNLY